MHNQLKTVEPLLQSGRRFNAGLTLTVQRSESVDASLRAHIEHLCVLRAGVLDLESLEGWAGRDVTGLVASPRGRLSYLRRGERVDLRIAWPSQD